MRLLKAVWARDRAQSVAKHTRSCRFCLQHLIKQWVVVNMSVSPALGRGIQCHPWLHSELQASVSNARHCLKKKKVSKTFFSLHYLSKQSSKLAILRLQIKHYADLQDFLVVLTQHVLSKYRMHSAAWEVVKVKDRNQWSRTKQTRLRTKGTRVWLRPKGEGVRKEKAVTWWGGPGRGAGAAW